MPPPKRWLPKSTRSSRHHSPNRRGFAGFPDKVVPIRWDERRYLIPTDDLVAFVNDINLNREPRASHFGGFLLARGDETKSVSGLPTLPADYAKLIRTQTLTVTVTSVRELEAEMNDGWCSKRYELHLDRGGQDGLVPGVELEPVDSPDLSRVTIVSVRSTSAVGSMQTYSPDCDSMQIPPATARQLTTGAFDLVAANREIAAATSNR